MIINCDSCGKATVIQRRYYNPKKTNLCKNCKDGGMFSRIKNSLKSIFTRKPKHKASGGYVLGR